MEILQLLRELPENDSFHESNLIWRKYINHGTDIARNVRKISLSESSSSDSDLEENIPSKCSRRSSEKTLNRKIVVKKMQKRRELFKINDPIKVIWKKRNRVIIFKIHPKCQCSSLVEPVQNILKEKPGNTPYSKINVACVSN